MTMVDGSPTLVTGASGYIGRRLCALLDSRGVKVRAQYRRSRPPEELRSMESPGFELVKADLSTAAGAADSARGAGAVIHAAALARDWGKASDFHSANVEATRNLLDAAEAAGCAEFVFVGSIAVHGFGDHADSSEDGPYYPLRNPYQASKLEAERMVLDRNRPGFRTSSLRLGYVYGPGDTTSTYRMFDAASRGFFGYIGSGRNRTSVIYVDDACAALASAIGNEAVAGQRVNIVSGEAIAWRDLAASVYSSLGLEPRPRRLPVPAAWAAAYAMAIIAGLSGSAAGPSLTPYRIRRSTVEYVFSNAKARRLLGFSPSVSFDEGLAIAAQAYKSRERGEHD